VNSARPKVRTTLALLWKEWREMVLVVPLGILWGLGIVGAVYVVEVDRVLSASQSLGEPGQELEGRPLPELDRTELAIRETAARWVIGLTTGMVLVVTAMIAAGTFAQEREGMTEHYLNSLAAGRKEVWCSKLAARALSAAFVYACVAIPIARSGLDAAAGWELYRSGTLPVVAASVFAVLFLASTLMSSSLDAVATGFVLWLIPFFVLAQIHRGSPWSDLFVRTSMLVVYSVLTALALGLSFLVHVKRYRAT